MKSKNTFAFQAQTYFMLAKKNYKQNKYKPIIKQSKSKKETFFTKHLLYSTFQLSNKYRPISKLFADRKQCCGSGSARIRI